MTVTAPEAVGITGALIFMGIWVAMMHSAMKVRQYRGGPWWQPILAPQDTPPEVQRYVRRFVILLAAGALTMIATIGLQTAVRGY